MKRYKQVLSLLLVVVMLFSVMPIGRAAAATTQELTGTIINVQDFGADSTGAKDSTKAVEKAIEAAKRLPKNEAKTIYFPEGEYHFYEETAPERELFVSNTVGIKPEHKMKHIGILLEEMQNVTVDGGGSMFMYHGDITAFAAIGCTNVTFRNFDFDHASPSVVDLTVESVLEGENAVTVHVPDCYTYEIVNGNSIHWMGEKGIVSGKPYWEGDNALQYCQIYDTKSGRCWRKRDHVASDLLFNDVKSIEDMGNGRLKFTYQSDRRELPVVGYSYEIRNTTRTTPGVFLWRSENVTL